MNRIDLAKVLMACIVDYEKWKADTAMTDEQITLSMIAEFCLVWVGEQNPNEEDDENLLDKELTE
jgi:hypothetical protein